jgi:hypothetical protein
VDQAVREAGESGLMFLFGGGLGWMSKPANQVNPESFPMSQSERIQMRTERYEGGGELLVRSEASSLFIYLGHLFFAWRTRKSHVGGFA